MRPSNRTYTEFWTGEVYKMYIDDFNHKTKLINEKNGYEIDFFYCSAFTSVKLKFYDKSEVLLSTGQFIKQDKLNPVTHKKFFFEKRYKKI